MIVLKYLFALLLVFSANVAPDGCVVCGYVPLNAPCILDTTDGALCAVEVYPPHPNICNAVWEPADERGYGYCWLTSGLLGKGGGISMPDNNEALFDIKAEALTTYMPKRADIYLCQDCLDKLNQLPMSNNFAIVDLYGLADDKVEFYVLTPDSDFWLRHYHIFVARDERGGLDIRVESTYFEGGKELDY